MKTLYFISMTTDNALRVLQRVSSVFSRNRVNIEQLHVFEAKPQNISHFNIAIYSENDLIDKLLKQLQKIVELHEVHIRSEMSVNVD